MPLYDMQDGSLRWHGHQFSKVHYCPFCGEMLSLGEWPGSPRGDQAYFSHLEYTCDSGFGMKVGSDGLYRWLYRELAREEA